MIQEHEIEEAKNAGWIVKDISHPELNTKTATRHWEAFRPDGTSFNRYFTESEAWEAIVLYRASEPGG